MLDTLRRGASGWLSKIVLGLIIASFIAFGITTRLTGFSTTEDALEVGSTKLSAAELDQQYGAALANYGAQIGRPLTKQEALQYGLPNQILTQIVSRTTLLEAARQLGLGVSDNAVRQAIVDDPGFKGPTGQFDRNLMRRVLYENRITEDTYIADRRQGLMQQQVSDAVVGGLKTPNAMLEVLNRYSQEERTIRYAVLDLPGTSTIADPAPDVLAKYFDARKATFKTQEQRVLQLITIDPSKISKPDDVSDADAKAVYDANIATYTTPEKRRVQQIPFDTKEAADAAAKRLAGGETFDALIAEMKLKPEDIDQGLLDKASFVDPTVADAAFQLPKAGDVSGVIQGKLRNVIIRVTEIAPGAVQSFDEVKPAIKATIAAQRADEAVRSLMKSIESARDERASFADLATRFKLDLVTTPPIDKDGKTPDGKPLAGVEDAAKLAKAAFESDVGNQNDPIALNNGGYLLFDVTTVTPPRDRTLDEVKPELTESWKAEQARTQLSDKTKDLMDRLHKGENFDDVAKSAGLEVKTTAAFKRSDTPEGLTPAAVTAAFSGGEGTVATAVGANDSRIILQVKDVNEPAFFAEAESLKQPEAQFTSSLKTSVENEYLRRVQAEQGLRVNQQVISQVVGLPAQQRN
jgi:peptidyl-prolyl cis-trans isomerase D